MLPIFWRAVRQADSVYRVPLIADLMWLNFFVQVEVSGFPTLFFFPGKSKGTPMQYQGARETEDLKEFIIENVSASLCCLVNTQIVSLSNFCPLSAEGSC